MIKILITTSSFGKVDEQPIQRLKEAGFEIKLNPHSRTLSEPESLDLMSGMDGLIAGTEKLNKVVLESASQLKYICRLGTGMDNVDFETARKQGITIENTPNAHVKSVAELTLGGMISLIRYISLADSNIKNGIWKKQMGTRLYGKTIGFVGLGKVGKYLVKLLQPFGVKIIAYELFPDAEFAIDYNVKYVPFDKVLTESDILTLHIPYSEQNHHIIDSKEIEQLKRNVKIINVSRGGLINEESLYHFLRTNSEAGAYIDTFEKEPYEGNLINLDNVLLTPHIGTTEKETRLDMEIEAAEKIIEFFKK